MFAIKLKLFWKLGNILQVKFMGTRYPSFDKKTKIVSS